MKRVRPNQALQPTQPLRGCSLASLGAAERQRYMCLKEAAWQAAA